MTHPPAAEELRRPHSGFLVADIHTAQEAFGAISGATFDDVLTVPTRIETDAEVFEFEVSLAFSRDGATELIQAASGPLAADVGLGFHHVGGIGSADLPEEIERQRALGSVPESRLFLDGRLFAVYFSATPQRPVRLEILAPFVADL
jgi:hypothetical protein